MIRHHAFHATLTLAAAVAIGVWWFIAKRLS